MSNDKNHKGGTSGSVVPLSIERELKTSFLDYAMSVIVSRALPDVRDGLKPVHRRILYAMHTLNFYYERPHRKSAKVVGEVISNYHPHGDSPIYQAMVVLAQDFSKRYVLLDGQGNWGSIDGDNAASMRYTEVRMAKIARDILADIEKETVRFTPNFDESCTEPTLLPSRIPNLLINGSNGIAVGMATSILPHNLKEIIDACIALLKDPKTDDDTLFALVPAPDFPTGGIICGRSGVVRAYKTGRGSVVVRGVVHIEDQKGKNAIIITEIPFQVNKADLISKIADLAKNKIVEGITNIRDESDRRGIRVVIDVRKNDEPQVILNQLYRHTSLQTSLSMNLLALLDNRPVIFTLREMIEQFLIHRRTVVTNRTKFDLKKSRLRELVLMGLSVALDHIDEVISLIKKSANAQEAAQALQEKFELVDAQIKAILEMRLQKLTGLEREKIAAEIKELQALIKELQTILDDENVLKSEIIKELEQIKKSYGDVRRTRIEGAVDNIEDIDLVPDDDVVVTLTRKGYVKRVPLDTYVVQHRGGKGKRAIADLSSADDIVHDIFIAKNHDDLLFFTNQGRVFSISVYKVPEASRTAKGRAVVNLLPLGKDEVVVKLLCTRDLELGYLVMVTKKGVIKKTDASSFSKVRSTGIRALVLNEGDELAFCALSSGEDTIVLSSDDGQGIRFKEKEVRPMGRYAAGVRGIKLRDDAFVVGLEVLTDDRDLLFATSRGYGKRVRIADFRVAHRGGLGVRTIPVDRRNGDVIGLTRVSNDSSVLLIDSVGKIIRLAPHEVRTMRRGAKGVRLIRLDSTQRLISVASCEEESNEVHRAGTAPSEVEDPTVPKPEGEIVEATEATKVPAEAVEVLEPELVPEVEEARSEKEAKSEKEAAGSEKEAEEVETPKEEAKSTKKAEAEKISEKSEVETPKEKPKAAKEKPEAKKPEAKKAKAESKVAQKNILDSTPEDKVGKPKKTASKK
ncbi:DNA gyrase subunit A [bacterium]|nr:DNA gyrase subunit A [bacterium]